MLKKSSVFMIVLLLVAVSLIGISSMYQALPVATAQSQQQTQISRTLVGTIDSFTFYSSDGKACIAFAVISESITKLYHQTPLPLGLKPGNDIALLVPDQTMCVILSQANIARTEIQFYVAVPSLTVKAVPSNIQQTLPPNQLLYRLVRITM